MLMWIEREERATARIDSVKFALLASRQGTMEQLFPEYIPTTVDGAGEYKSVEDVKEAKGVIDLFDLLKTSGALTIKDLEGGESNGNAN